MDRPVDRSQRFALRLITNPAGPSKPAGRRKSAVGQLVAARKRAVSAIRNLAELAMSRGDAPWVADVELALAEIDEALTAAMFCHYARIERDGNGSASQSVEPAS